MFSLQVTLSGFRSRKRQYLPVEPLNVVLRFGSIKLDIIMTSNGDQLLGGKRILLDLSPDQLKHMFLNYALGMFIENQQGRFFSILSLQKLDFSHIVSSQQVYFYNDNQEIFYSTNFSIIFNVFNPRMPNKQKIQNHKTFNQFFKKPAIPSHQVPPKTLSSFLYGKRIEQSQKLIQNLASTSGKISKQKPSSAKMNSSNSQKNKKISEISTQMMMKTKNLPQFTVQSHPQIKIYNPYEKNEQIDDENPPIMQFTNTVADPSKGINLLKTQMAELNLTAPQSIKFITAYDSKNAFSKSKTKETKNTIIKIQEKLKQTQQNSSLLQTKVLKENIDIIRINRDELKNKAKQQMESYQGNNNIKIPILKNGKYEFVELGSLSEHQIADFAKKQKQIQMEEEKARMAEQQLKKKEKQNSLLKKQLEEKQRLLHKQQQEVKRQKLELLKAQRLAQQNKKLELVNQMTKKTPQPQDSYDQDEQQDKYDEEASQKDSNQQKQEEQNYYDSDFESMSMASAQKKSRISVSSQKKHEQSQSYNDYNESYDPDFESYSQSLLGSQHKLSMSEMSESLKNFSSKRK